MKGSTAFSVFTTTIISAVILFAGLVSASIADNHVYDIEKDSICETTACIQEASFILGNMNSSMDPCENFYEFACGKFFQETIIPDDKDRVGLFSTIDDKIDQQLRHEISADIKEDDQPSFKMLKSYYQMCMNADKTEENSQNDLQEVLRQLGGCPALEGKTAYVGNDLDKINRSIIIIDQPQLSLSRESFVNDENYGRIDKYLGLMVDFFNQLEIDIEQAEDAAIDIVDFERELAKISLSENEHYKQRKANNRMTLHQLETKYVGIPWAEYLNGILDPYAYLHRNEEVIVAAPTFLKRLPELSANTPKRVLANSICFRVTSQSIDYVAPGISNIDTEITRVLFGIQEQLPRWKKCLALAKKHFDAALSGLYVKHYFDKNSKVDAAYLIENLRNGLDHLIKQSDWMDNTTKLAAIEKLESMKAYVGYPDDLDDNDKINKLYQNITLHPRSFLETELSIRRFDRMVQYSQIKNRINVSKWVDYSTNIAEAGASNVLTDNTFSLPAGILQGHFYNIDRPNYINYGAIGIIIGHELSHAFDNEGSEYDKNGDLVNWWKNETREEYFNRVRCVIEQYGNYTVKETNLMVNGILSQGENIADNVGVKAARYAYNKWAKKHGKEPRLPGLRYTPHQMFWISYANMWCAKHPPESLECMTLNDPHSSSETRVIGVLSNSQQFSKDFNCPLGSPMNPVKKCKIW